MIIKIEISRKSHHTLAATVVVDQKTLFEINILITFCEYVLYLINKGFWKKKNKFSTLMS